MGEGVTLVSSNTETANDVYRTLVSQGLERKAPGEPSLRFEATGTDARDFLRLAHRFMGPEVSRVDLVQTGAIELPAP
jgi:glutamate racemase